MLAERAKTECVRYKEIYNLNYMDFTNYDLIIDGTYSDPDTITDIIMEEAKEYYNNPQKASIRLVSPKSFIFEEFNEEEDKVRLADMVKDLKNKTYIKDRIIKVNSQSGAFTALDDMDFVKAALLAGVNYISIEIA